MWDQQNPSRLALPAATGCGRRAPAAIASTIPIRITSTARAVSKASLPGMRTMVTAYGLFIFAVLAFYLYIGIVNR